MKYILTITIAFIVSASLAQTTIPIKNKAFIDKVTVIGKGIRLYGYLIALPCNYKSEDVWAKQYHGKWYSNYPYVIKFTNNRHTALVYKNRKLIHKDTFK